MYKQCEDCVKLMPRVLTDVQIIVTQHYLIFNHKIMKKRELKNRMVVRDEKINRFNRLKEVS